MTEFPTVAALVVAHVLAAMLTHEAGHAVMARVLGARLEALGWGLISSTRWVRLRGVVFFVGAQPWMGMTTYVFPRAGWERWRWVCVAGAGSCVNGLLGAWLWSGGWPVWGALHLLHGMANLLPSLGGGSPSDGEQLWRMLRGESATQAVWGRISMTQRQQLADVFQAVGSDALAAWMRGLGAVQPVPATVQRV